MNAVPQSLIEANVPFALMPVAALAGLYAVAAISRTIYILHANATKDSNAPPKRTTARERLSQKQGGDGIVPVQSREFATLVLSSILSLIAYAFLVARVEAGYQRAQHKSFDPYALLGLPRDATLNTTVVQEAFKKAVDHHKADETALGNIKLAYQALQDERGILNYQRFGHPLGPLEVEAFCLRVPKWLLPPTGSFAWATYLVYLGAVAAVLYTVYKYYKNKQDQLKTNQRTEEEKQKAAAALLDSSNSVSAEDLSFLVNHLAPDSSYFDILFSVCATPDTLQWSLNDLENIVKLREERVRQDEKKDEPAPIKKKDDLDLGALLDEGGWDDDDDANKGKSASSEEELKAGAAAPAKQVFEGMDKGVLGQKWVEKALKEKQQWPPPSVPVLKSVKYEDEVLDDPLDHPGLRRVLCMTMGRLNSHLLNTHPELVEAGTNQLIDQTYFRASLDFRQRVGLLLEGALRLGMMLRSYRLVATIIESVAVFKIGCLKNKETLEWFQVVMKRSNNCLPWLQIHSSSIASSGHEEIATKDLCEIVLDLERTHADNFLKSKIAVCQKQGIPPQAALQMYREGWWILLRSQRLDGPTPPQALNLTAIEPFNISPEQIKLFESEKPEDQLVTAMPILVSNIALQRGKFTVKFRAPDVPGRYKYMLAIKSQDFLGADQELELTATVVDASTVDREKPENESQPDDESKKDK